MRLSDYFIWLDPDGVRHFVLAVSEKLKLDPRPTCLAWSNIAMVVRRDEAKHPTCVWCARIPYEAERETSRS